MCHNLLELLWVPSCKDSNRWSVLIKWNYHLIVQDLYIIIAFAISRCCSKDGQPRLNSIEVTLLVWSSLFVTNLAACLWTTSIIVIVFCANGDHTVLEYSKIDLTIDLNRPSLFHCFGTWTNVSLQKCLNRVGLGDHLYIMFIKWQMLINNYIKIFCMRYSVIYSLHHLVNGSNVSKDASYL